MKLKLFFLLIYLSIHVIGKSVEVDSIFISKNLNTISKGGNSTRYKLIKRTLKNCLNENVRLRTESIDWLGLYRNIIVEKTGNCDSVVYIVCHYDKTDGNVFTSFNSFFNGDLDILFSPFYLSKGAYDNGSGVVTSLALLDWMKSKKTKYTYRFLFAGMEEYGLRGSRRHVSGLKMEDWNKCVCAVNIDMVGGAGIDGISLTQNVSDSCLIALADSAANKVNLKLLKTDLPKGGLSDFYSFTGHNFKKDISVAYHSGLIGAIIPQRSYFTKNKKGIPVVDFSDDIKIGNFKMLLSYFSPVSFGEIHSLKDNITVVDIKNVVNYQIFFREFITNIENKYD